MLNLTAINEFQNGLFAIYFALGSFPFVTSLLPKIPLIIIRVCVLRTHHFEFGYFNRFMMNKSSFLIKGKTSCRSQSRMLHARLYPFVICTEDSKIRTYRKQKITVRELCAVLLCVCVGKCSHWIWWKWRCILDMEEKKSWVR